MVRGDSDPRPSRPLPLSRGNQVVHDETRCPYDDYDESFCELERECADVTLGHRAGTTQTATEQLKSMACTFAAYESTACGAVAENRQDVRRALASLPRFAGPGCCPGQERRDGYSEHGTLLLSGQGARR